jgi:tetratricopeptide (TPR) repeat protein
MGKVRLFLVASLTAGFATAQNRVPPGSNPYPFGVPAVQSRPATPPQPSNAGHAQAAQNTPAQPPQQYLPYVPVYFVDPYWDAYGYGYWNPPWWRHVYTYPPVYLLPGTWFGWQAPQPGLLPANAGRPGRLAARNQPLAAPEPPQPEPADRRATNAESTALGRKFIGYGDAWFAKGKYLEANARYRDAARSAPQLADAYFRQGFALVAMGSYAQAVKAVQRGLAIDPRWPDSPFQLDDLYGPNAAAKDAHRTALVRAAREQSGDADVAFLLGVYFHFDHHADLAAKWFDRAARLLGNHSRHVELFLNKGNGLPPAPPQPGN